MNFSQTTPLNIYCAKNKLSLLERIHLLQKIAALLASLHARRKLADLVFLNNPSINADSELVVREDAPPSAPLPPDSLIVPELIAGMEHTAATDIFIWGVLAYRLLSGCEPFDLQYLSESEIETVIRTCSPASVRASKDGELLPLSLETLILSALAPEPERRPSANSVCEQLKKIRRDDMKTLQWIDRVKRAAHDWYLTGESPRFLWTATSQLDGADMVYTLHRTHLDDVSERFIRKAIQQKILREWWAWDAFMGGCVVASLVVTRMKPTLLGGYLLLLAGWRVYARFNGKPFGDCSRLEKSLKIAVALCGLPLPFLVREICFRPAAISISCICLVWLWDLIYKQSLISRRRDCGSVVVWSWLRRVWVYLVFLSMVALLLGDFLQKKII